jgi:hypothetical protein
MNKFVQRLKEPSTWAGLAILAITLGLDPHKVAALGQLANAIVPLVPVDGGVLAHVITAAAASAAVFMPEKPGAAAPAAE